MGKTATVVKLEKESDEYRKALQSEIDGWVKNSKDIALRIILIGGGLTLAFIIISKLLKDKNDTGSKESEASIFSEMKSFILRELSVFLLALAKERLINYLDESDEDFNTENTE